MDLFQYGQIQYCVGMIEATKAQIVAMQVEDSFQPDPALRHTAEEYKGAANLISSFANDIHTYARG